MWDWLSLTENRFDYIEEFFRLYGYGESALQKVESSTISVNDADVRRGNSYWPYWFYFVLGCNDYANKKPMSENRFVEHLIRLGRLASPMVWPGFNPDNDHTILHMVNEWRFRDFICARQGLVLPPVQVQSGKRPSNIRYIFKSGPRFVYRHNQNMPAFDGIHRIFSARFWKNEWIPAQIFLD